jgi:kynurenine formamidase
MRTRLAIVLGALALAVLMPASASASRLGLWRVYNQSFAKARYINLTHEITPDIPVWKGFGESVFEPSVDPATGQPYTWAGSGFEATAYRLSTDQLGTQLDPPAHWDPNYPAIDELPPTYAVRPLVVISIVPQVKKNPTYFMTVKDIKRFERTHERIPRGSVVMVRSDWSFRWSEDPEAAKKLAADPNFPSVSLAALKFLHRKRHILFHGHEPLDTDTTPTLEGESWLMHHGFTQAEGVDDLEKVPATGCLISIGYPRFKGGLGGYARFVAICPPSWREGRRISRRDAPLPRKKKTLHWNDRLGYRTR